MIDWSNSHIGDPALDFVRLALDRGWKFTREVLAAYQLPVKDDFLDAIRAHAQPLARQCLADALERGFDPTLQEIWVRNAFSRRYLTTVTSWDTRREPKLFMERTW